MSIGLIIYAVVMLVLLAINNKKVKRDEVNWYRFVYALQDANKQQAEKDINKSRYGR